VYRIIEPFSEDVDLTSDIRELVSDKDASHPADSGELSAS
jgi:hypothetical protein